MTDTDTEALAHATHLADLARLSSEQTSRIGFRDNLAYATLGATGVIGWTAIQSNGPHLLVLIPLVCYVLGWTYLRNDRKVSQIDEYIGGPLTVRLIRITGDSDVLSWNTARSGSPDPRRAHRKWMQLSVDLGLFVAPSAVAVYLVAAADAEYEFGYGTYLLLAVAVIATSVLTAAIITDADVPRPPLTLTRLRRRTGK